MAEAIRALRACIGDARGKSLCEFSTLRFQLQIDRSQGGSRFTDPPSTLAGRRWWK